MDHIAQFSWEQSPLASGSFGSVFRAIYNPTGEVYAIKAVRICKPHDEHHPPPKTMARSYAENEV